MTAPAAVPLNGRDPAEMRAYVEQVRSDPQEAERRPILTAVWTGGDRSRLTISGKTMDVNGPAGLSPMQLVLAAIASCEVDVIVRECTLAGVEVEDLAIEVHGEFDVRSFLGIAGAPPSGYERIAYVARIRAPSLTDGQLAHLREAVEHTSPVGDTLARAVRLEPRIERA